MVELTLSHDKLMLEVQGMHKLWALKSRLEIPWDHLRAVHADPEPAMGWFQGLKLSGTDLPNIFRAGTYYQDGGFVFWDVRHPENTIVVDLNHERFKKLIIEVEDPNAAVRMINKKALSKG